MPLSCYVPSQIIPKSRIVHLADKQILKRHILSYPKITVSKNPPGEGFDTWPMDYYGRHTALRGRLAALGFTPLFSWVECLSAGLTLTGGASAAGMGAAGTGPTGMGTALGFTPLLSWVERLSAGLTLTCGASAAGMGAAGTGPTGMGTALGFTPLFTRVERLSAGLALTGGESAAGMGATGMGAAGMGAARMGAAGMGAAGMGVAGMGAAGGKPTVTGWARTRPDQGTVGWPEQMFPVSAPLRQQPIVPWQATGYPDWGLAVTTCSSGRHRSWILLLPRTRFLR